MGILKKLLKKIFKNEINAYKGKKGEKRVNKKLNPFFSFSYSINLSDYIFIDEKNISHQLDHIEIRNNGIFVIETKTYIGKIYGEKASSKWRQVLYNKINYFYNPLKQNNSHIYHLNKLLNDKYKVNSLIVFTNNNAPIIEDVENCINLDELKDYLEDFDNGIKLKKEEIDAIYNELIDKEADIDDDKHLENIKNQEENIKKGICPRCGAKLVKRNGKYGELYGCGNYPKCRFKIKEIE